MAQPLEQGTFEKPDDVREGSNWRLELLNLAGGAQVGRLTLQPGWRYSGRALRRRPRTSQLRESGS